MNGQSFHQESPESGPKPVRGTLHLFLAFDVAQSIDLDKAAELVRSGATRGRLEHSRRAPSSMTYQPAPLCIRMQGEPRPVGAWQTDGAVDVTLFDFGAASVEVRVPFESEMVALVDLASVVEGDLGLVGHLRERLAGVLSSVTAALRNPAIADRTEDYMVFSCRDVSPSVLETSPAVWSRVVRGDRARLSAEEVQEVMSGRMSYSEQDAVVVDWSGALLVDPQPGDTLRVLEFANVELLEMRHLDERLDEAIEQSFGWINRRRWFDHLRPSHGRRRLERLATLRADGGAMFESVNNALKLLGDHYLSRVYRLATQRMGLPAWESNVLRKLDTLESIYEKVSDRESNLRMEFLEWIIILLIAFEVVMSFVR